MKEIFVFDMSLGAEKENKKFLSTLKKNPGFNDTTRNQINSHIGTDSNFLAFYPLPKRNEKMVEEILNSLMHFIYLYICVCVTLNTLIFLYSAPFQGILAV